MVPAFGSICLQSKSISELATEWGFQDCRKIWTTIPFKCRLSNHLSVDCKMQRSKLALSPWHTHGLLGSLLAVSVSLLTTGPPVGYRLTCLWPSVHVPCSLCQSFLPSLSLLWIPISVLSMLGRLFLRIQIFLNVLKAPCLMHQFLFISSHFSNSPCHLLMCRSHLILFYLPQ